MTERIAPGGSPFSLADALTAWAAGVTLITMADGRDDIGTTVSAFCPVSADPPVIAVALMAESYPAEVLGRGDPDRASRFAVTLLGSAQRSLAGRFAAAGRPGARLLLDGVPHRRGEQSGALIPDDGLAALECSVTQRIPAGDHLLLLAQVLAVPYVAPAGAPLVRFRGGYPALA